MNTEQRSSLSARSLRAMFLPLVAGTAVTIGACTDSATSGSDVSGSTDAAGPIEAASGTEAPDVLAVIGEEEITLADLRIRLGERLDQMQNTYLRQRHQLIDEALKEFVSNRVVREEADKRGLSVNALLREETGEGVEITEVEIAAWYDENRSRVGTRTLDQLRGQIANHLRTTRSEEARENLEARLKSEYGVVYHLQPFRLVLNNEGAPSRGPRDAAVTLVEFSDFECPFCSSFFPTLKRIEEEYGDRIRVVYRQFPLPNLHPAAFKAAEASLCADEQGEFWEFHDLLFQEQDRLAVRDLKEKAGRIGLDQGDFDACLDTGRYTEQVQDDVSAGKTAGVTGTPALFVNGIPISGGAVPFETVAEVLDRELERVENEL